jgi:hypothetical protein
MWGQGQLFCLNHSPCRNVIIYVFFHFKYYKTGNEGLLCLNEKLPRRTKIRKRNILLILQAASSSYELPAPPPPQPVATPAKVSKPLQKNNM